MILSLQQFPQMVLNQMMLLLLLTHPAAAIYNRLNWELLCFLSNIFRYSILYRIGWTRRSFQFGFTLKLLIQLIIRCINWTFHWLHILWNEFCLLPQGALFLIKFCGMNFSNRLTAFLRLLLGYILDFTPLMLFTLPSSLMVVILTIIISGMRFVIFNSIDMLLLIFVIFMSCMFTLFFSSDSLLFLSFLLLFLFLLSQFFCFLLFMQFP